MSKKKKLLMAYSVLNKFYYNGAVKQIRGRFASDRGGVLDVENPDATYVPLEPKMQDPKLLPFAFSQDPVILVAKVTTETAGGPSTCLYDLYGPDAGGGKAWKRLAQDVTLVSSGDPVLTNPYGVAQAEDLLCMVDFDSRSVYSLGVNELNGLSGDHDLFFPPLDLSVAPPNSTTPILPLGAKGQSIIALRGPDGVKYVFAIFIVYTGNTVPTMVWSPSILVRMKINDGGTLQYVDHIELGINAQELIPVASDNNSITFFVTCYGGSQNLDGSTNGNKSMLQKVVVNFTTSNMTATPILTGDTSTSASTYDIRAFAARLDGNGAYLLTGTLDGTPAENQNWTLYKTEVATLLGYSAAKALSAAELAGDIVNVDFGQSDPGNYWDIFIETGLDVTGDRLWFLRGSTIEVTAAEDYGDDKKTFEPGYGSGQLDGINVNSVAFTAETIRQASLGMSLKRGLRGMVPIISAAAEGREELY
jgi:hypothetical protein